LRSTDVALVKLDLNPSTRKLNQFGAIAAVLFGVVGAFVLLRGTLFGVEFSSSGAQTASWLLFGAAAVVALSAAVVPRGLRPFFVVLSMVTMPIGFVLSYVLLFLMYFGVFTPIGIAMRLTGWDPMQRVRAADATTYWRRRGAPAAAARYFNQY